ncbi:hypothetical protein OPQ81_001219 [Rhizoctonia solani]|nr:hypothetical protein OPQ81_001219 [Rhizoctonia solani]
MGRYTSTVSAPFQPAGTGFPSHLPSFIPTIVWILLTTFQNVLFFLAFYFGGQNLIRPDVTISPRRAGPPNRNTIVLARELPTFGHTKLHNDNESGPLRKSRHHAHLPPLRPLNGTPTE